MTSIFFNLRCIYKEKVMDNSEIIKRLVEAQIQLKFLHWQTKSYAKHQAYGGLYNDLDELIDDFVEACMGKHGRPSYQGGYTIQGQDISEISIQNFIDGVYKIFCIHQIFSHNTFYFVKQRRQII